MRLYTPLGPPQKVLMLLDGSDTYIFDDDADQDPRARVIMDTEENKLSITEVQLSSHENLHMHRTLDIIVEIPQVSSSYFGEQLCSFIPKPEKQIKPAYS